MKLAVSLVFLIIAPFIRAQSTTTVPGGISSGTSLTTYLRVLKLQDEGGKMSSEQQMDAIYGMGYFTGFLDSCTFTQQIKMNIGFTLPKGVSVLQLIRVV